jgi:hypothetical protein
MLVSDSGRRSDRDKSYSGERDFPRKRRSATPHLGNQKCRKSALTSFPQLGPILDHPWRYGSIGETIAHKFNFCCPSRRRQRYCPLLQRKSLELQVLFDWVVSNSDVNQDSILKPRHQRVVFDRIDSDAARSRSTRATGSGFISALTALQTAKPSAHE